jgi:hypothetical protein
MRKEFIKIVDEMASDSVTDQKHYGEVQPVLKENYAAHVHYSSSDLSSDSDSEPNFPHAKDEEEMTDGDQKAAAIEKTTDRTEAAKALPHAKDQEEMMDGDQKAPEPNFLHAKDEEEMTDGDQKEGRMSYGDQKPAAIEKSTDRKAAAKALSSLQENVPLHYTAPKKPSKKYPRKSMSHRMKSKERLQLL